MSNSDEKNEAQKALDEARQLTQDGDYEQALAKHIWFHENALKIEPSLCGIRLSYALRDWINLGREFPMALAKLEDIRDSKSLRLRGGENCKELFHDVAAINSYLEEPDATVTLFKEIEVATPSVAPSIYKSAEKAIVSAKNYTLARKYISDPLNRFTIAQDKFDAGMKFAAKDEKAEWSRKAFEYVFVKDVVLLITVLKNTGESDFAREIQAKALEVFSSPEIRNAPVE